MTERRSSLGQDLRRGLLAGLAGTLAMTAFQKLVEMPLTGREDSYAPARFAEKVLPVQARDKDELERLNWVTHFGIGMMWGSAYGVAAHAGLSGPKALAVVFGTVYTGDVALNTALGLYEPASWSLEDWAIDIVDKLVQAAATGAVLEQVIPNGSKPR